MNSNKFIIDYDNIKLNIELKNVYYKHKKIGYIYLYVNNIKEGMYLFYQIRYSFGEKYLELGNIPKNPSSKYKNKGIGTEALKMIDLIAIQLKAPYILGGISKHDYDHIERLTHFYQKNGYEILYNNHNSPCAIKKIIKKLNFEPIGNT